MYAIIRTGGKQYKVQPGDTVRVEKLHKNLGDKFDITEVLFVGGEKSFIGAPLVQNAKVSVVVTQQAKAPKIIVFKKKRRQGYRRMQGHRQLFTELFITSITSPEGKMTETDKNAVVFNPAKKQERMAMMAAKVKAAGNPKAAKRAAAANAKDPVKKTAKKKASGKKNSSSKAKSAKKVAKKAAKKTAAKK